MSARSTASRLRIPNCSQRFLAVGWSCQKPDTTECRPPGRKVGHDVYQKPTCRLRMPRKQKTRDCLAHATVGRLTNSAAAWDATRYQRQWGRFDMTCPLLDNLFTWAAQQPAGYKSTVQCNLVTNQSTYQGDENLVVYAEGTLTFSPGRWIDLGEFRIYIPSSFAGSVTRYSSLDRYGVSGGFAIYPFSYELTDTIDIYITAPLIGSYSVSINLPASAPANLPTGSTQSFTPQCEAGVIYGSLGNSGLAVISLCNQVSNPPPVSQ